MREQQPTTSTESTQHSALKKIIIFYQGSNLSPQESQRHNQRRDDVINYLKEADFKLEIIAFPYEQDCVDSMPENERSQYSSFLTAATQQQFSSDCKILAIVPENDSFVNKNKRVKMCELFNTPSIVVSSGVVMPVYWSDQKKEHGITRLKHIIATRFDDDLYGKPNLLKACGIKASQEQACLAEPTQSGGAGVTSAASAQAFFAPVSQSGREQTASATENAPRTRTPSRCSIS